MGKYDIYLVTGASGYLGRVLVKKLVSLCKHVRVLLLPNEQPSPDLDMTTEVCHGNIVDKPSLESFFHGDLSNACLVHCAGVVSIASGFNRGMYEVNVKGTANVMELCVEHNVPRVVYVSSVHAIPEGKRGTPILEVGSFSENTVRGHYAKTKALGTGTALEYAKKGLNLSVVHPSGLIGPYGAGGNITSAVIAFCRGSLPFAVNGGYDFVDVRDVSDGIVACTERGRRGECYILSGHYATLRTILGILKALGKGKNTLFLPLWLVKLISPLTELYCSIMRKPLFLTPYSAYTLGCNAVFDHGKASGELGYSPRKLEVSLIDMVEWLRKERLV